jgi:hypothetical protein
MKAEDGGNAILSDCDTYRYVLTRMWGPGERLVWVMLNPSTADAYKDDQTIRRVRGFTMREGFDGFDVVNVWAYRATSPKDLHRNRSAYEPENIEWVKKTVRGKHVVVAWGNNISRGPAYQHIKMALWHAKSARCLGTTKSGEPRHPLMLRADTPLEPWAGWIKNGAVASHPKKV